ncbi:MAG: hypothetical protein RBG13Loki_1588 [Promethearchaeota archaeon CR_4]|nr:MAG: hypothetical protein RBG13Loki_1588 [Candidatus Lokiarchaeota archaeon CR_4]
MGGWRNIVILSVKLMDNWIQSIKGCIFSLIVVLIEKDSKNGLKVVIYQRFTLKGIHTYSIVAGGFGVTSKYTVRVPATILSLPHI